MANNAVVRAVEKELAHYPGVQMEIRADRGRHQRALFQRGEASRFLVLPRTPSDWRAGKNAIRDFRKTMGELGARRLDVLPGQVRGRRTFAAVGIALNEKVLTIHIPANSKLLDRFKTENNRPKGVWRVEVRASPDLEAPPMVALIKATLPPGKERAAGYVGGFVLNTTGAWRLQFARGTVPAFARHDLTFGAVDVELYHETASELVFKLPSGVLPTTFKRPEARPVSPPPEVEDEIIEAPLNGRPAPERVIERAAPAPAPSAAPQSLVLQWPKQPLNVEQAINYLNAAKRKHGANLKFQIVEDGFLTAVQRLGH